MTNLHSTSREIQTIYLIATILTLISKQGIIDTCFVDKHLLSKVILNNLISLLKYQQCY